MNNQASMPPYFQWIIDKRLAICAHPFHASHIRYLLEQRLQTVISITDTYNSGIPNQSRGDLHVHTLNIPDGGAPTMQQCQQFVQRMEIARQREEVTFLFPANSIFPIYYSGCSRRMSSW
jgi:hypothetical protein